MERAKSSYAVLAIILAVANGLLAAVVFGLFYFKKGFFDQAVLPEVMGTLGLVGLAYYLSLHQLIKKLHLGLSTLLLALLSILNLTLLIIQTGGLESPYYALWLLAIMVAGIFGPWIAAVAVAGTVAAFIYTWAGHQFSGAYLGGHLVQFIISLAAGGLAEWLYWPARRGAGSAAKVTQVQLSEAEQGALINSVGEGVIVVNVQRQIQLINPAAQSLTGWDASTARGLDYRLVLNLKTGAGKDLDDADDPFAQAWFSRHPALANNLSMITKAGRKVFISMSTSPILDQGGNLTGAVGLFRDISAEREIERQRSEFISTASHEMRTPVAAIEGYIALALNTQTATVDTRAKGYLEKAHATSEHLGKLFRDLLSATKFEDKRITDKLEPVDLVKLLDETVEALQFNAKKKGLTLAYRPAVTINTNDKMLAPLIYVQANPDRLREVVTNLIDNAIKYTQTGGITVSLAGNDPITVSVADTGPGIAREDLPHLFQKFYRVDQAATRTVGGTGLGLYLCRHVIELYNGRIWAESTPGRGSVFSFSLPRLKATPLATGAPTTPEARPASTATAPAAAVATAAPSTATQIPVRAAVNYGPDLLS